MQKSVCIVGLGYVGLPLAYTFAKKNFTVYGFDISSDRIQELKNGKDRTDELTESQLKEVQIEYSDDPSIIGKADVVILAIPTPVDDKNKPDLTLVEKASETVGKNMKKGAIVVYESTVYPGTTEEICAPILEKMSGGRDFKLGYSPERVNPGDKEHTIDKIIKIVSGEDEETTDILCELYGSITTAGIHRAPNIKVAEMAKAIENAQRDLNIAFMNEVALLSHKIGINTNDVLKAAGTKWNFLNYKPGLVGGHCIGVDPYYLVEKAEQLGIKTHVIAAGRGVNDSMSKLVAEETLSALNTDPKKAKVLVMGLTFKEDIPDIRNSKSFDVIKELEKAGCTVEVHDPEVHEKDWARFSYKRGELNGGSYDAILILVSHREYVNTPTEQFVASTKESGVIYDLKSILDPKKVTNRTLLTL